MDTVSAILANIIEEQGAEYLQRSPYAVYQKLISEKARPDYARLVLMTQADLSRSLSGQN